jgi:tripeptide aminopeptidase
MRDEEVGMRNEQGTMEEFHAKTQRRRERRALLSYSPRLRASARKQAYKGFFYFSLLIFLLVISCNAEVAEKKPQLTGDFEVKTSVLERFLRYTSYDTQSDPDSKTSPSTGKQLTLAKALHEECKAIGLTEVTLSGHGIVMATLPSNTQTNIPVLGFIAHMDTAPAASGKNVTPKLFENYDGKDIVLNSEVTISPDEFPFLLNYTGQTIITANGDTLLGADDKSGIAEILTAMEYLLRNPHIPRGKIRIAFTPDEEVGRGTENFDVKAFGADFAFTIDGGELGELLYENFNAAKAEFEITGKSVHPGYAKDILINAAIIAAELASAFPHSESPETTEGYEGYYFVQAINGDAAAAKMKVDIRTFDRDDLEARKKFVTNLAAEFNTRYGEDTIKVEIIDQYYNMKEMIDPQIIEYAKAAFAAAGIEAISPPQRGGTDGAMLSFKGLPCPNIFAGGHNFHGPYEFIPLESMEKAVDVIINLCRADE